MDARRAELARRLAAVRARVAAACAAAGRSPDEVALLAVTKTVPAADVATLLDLGLDAFGENRVQEAAAKAEQVSVHPDLVWALIGHLQTNKARTAAGFAREFHALDSMKVAHALHRRLHETSGDLDVFVQVNSSGEPQKYGLRPEQVEAFAHDVARLGTLRVRGLMTLAVLSDDRAAVESCFARMRSLQRDLQAAGAPGSFDELSMGMSGDFELAIEYGATTVRVGEAIFGRRTART
jgi:pyridoxal phosphate enzyme (YggS family)